MTVTISRGVLAVLMTVATVALILGVWFYVSAGIDKQKAALDCQTIQFINPAATCAP